MTKSAVEIWDRDRLQNPHAVADKQKRVQNMFAAIAPSYDLNNRLWSGGTDQRWRRRAVKLSKLKPGDRVVDVACGTGDLTLAYAKALAGLRGRAVDPAQVIGVDYTYEMLPPGRTKATDDARFPLLQGDAQNLPLPDVSADVVSIAFGIRNVADSNKAYAEFRRVLRPGGRAVVLEFSKPTNRVLRFGYDLYFNHVLTRLAALVARDKTGAYRYLASSVETFKPREQMVAELETAGFERVEQHPLTFGIAVIYVGHAPAS
ncbi:MAG: bifunctional demethylmenaquinone methyltransferase/2-methoxy-6-polyprenyl-1,4-benzoquinol methylase UbiE [Planctomycetota bacterium]